jgi:hypothetical protein
MQHSLGRKLNIIIVIRETIRSILYAKNLNFGHDMIENGLLRRDKKGKNGLMVFTMADTLLEGCCLVKFIYAFHSR